MSTDTDRIRALNDRLRRNLLAGKAVMTPRHRRTRCGGGATASTNNCSL